ncbi:MAG: HAH_0734 family protein [Halodesulfurarchaeum sp.]
MKRLIIHGDPDVRKDGIIEVGGEEYVLFQVTRNGDWHGPARVQLWCIAGSEDEREDFERRNFIPQFLDVESVDAEEVTVTKRAGDLAV